MRIESEMAGGGAGLRVLHLMPTNFGMTGVETFILQLAAAQRRAGLAPALALDLTNRAEVAEACAAMGTPVHDLSRFAHVPGRGGPRFVVRARSAGRRLRLALAMAGLARRFEVLHVHSVGVAGSEGMIGAALAGRCPSVVTHHTTYAYGLERPDRAMAFRLERRLASRLVVPYARAAEDYLAAGIPHGGLEVIPFCVDEERFAVGPVPQPAPAPGELHLVFSARIFEGKGHDVLLEAMARLRPRYPGLRATIVGDGPNRAAVEALIDRLELRAVISMTGRVAHADVPRLIRSGDVIVLPSHMVGETFPLCLLEGMAMGLPAIGTIWTGIPDIIADGETGLLVPPQDVGALAQAIERFILDRTFLAKAGLAASARVQAHFTSKAVAGRYSRLYAALRR